MSGSEFRQPAPAALPQVRPPGNGLATAGMILAIIALALCLIPVVNALALFLAILGLVFGIIGLIKANEGRPGKGMAIAAIVMSILAGVGFAISTAIAAATFSAINEGVTEIDKGMDDLDQDVDEMTGDATSKILKKDLAVEIGTFEATSDGGFVTSALPVTLTNKANKVASYDVTIEATDSDGNRITDDWVTVTKLGPGQSETSEIFTLIDEKDVESLKSAKFKVVEASKY